MGDMLQLILGVCLVVSGWGYAQSLDVRQDPQVNELPILNTTPTPNITEINNRDLNKIIKDDPKSEENIVKSLKQNTVKLLKSEPYTSNEEHSSKETQSSGKNDDNFEEETKRKDNREENSRAIDLDIDRFISEEFHNKNNVFTIPYSSSDGEKFFDDFDFRTTTRDLYRIESELTTPKTDFFDHKYKQAVDSVEQKLDTADFDADMDDEDDDTEDDDSKEQNVNPARSNYTNLEYVKMKNVINETMADKNSIHKNMGVEHRRNFNFENSYNETKVYDDTTEETKKERLETTTTRPHSVLTTRKGTTYTKTPSSENNSHIISNKIESETIKAINAFTPSESVIIETQQSVTTLNPLVSVSIRPTTDQNRLQENQVVPIEFPSTENVINSSTTTQETIQSTSTTLQPTEEQTTTTVTETTSIISSVTTEEVTSTTDTPSTVETTTTTENTRRSSKSVVLVAFITTPSQLEETSTEIATTNVEHITESTTNDQTDKTTTETLKTNTIESLEHTTSDYVETTTEERSKQPEEVTSTETAATTTQNVKSTTEQQPTTTINETLHVETTTVLEIMTKPDEISYKKGKIEGNNSEQHTTPSEDASEGTTVITPTEDGLIKDVDDSKGTIVAIVLSTVGAVCLVLLAGLLYVMRKRQKRFNYGPRCRPVGLDDYSIDNVSVFNSVRRKNAARASKRSYGNPAFEDPVQTSHPLNFPALVKFSTNSEDIKAEFEEIPQISARTSELPDGCEPKNRYANVIPLPETRVYLTASEGQINSDYINANYVTGPKNHRGFYIATQGPMENTVDDFWRMVWEQQSKVILMMTHLFENGVEKCADYLPPSEVLDCNRLFGDFQITLKKREVKEKYIISILQLKNMVSNSWREVTHFWYLGWPEKGVPSEANSLIAFLIEARSYMKSSSLDRKQENGNMKNGSIHNEINPVVVHCSPGTGRTGVVIACDIAIREFEQTRLVDIPKIVYRIRRDRANAVQTKEQYQFIYKVVSLYATKLTGGVLDSF